MPRIATKYTLEHFNIDRTIVGKYLSLSKGGRLPYNRFLNLKNALFHQTNLHNVVHGNIPHVKATTACKIAYLLYKHEALTCEQLSLMMKCKVRNIQKIVKALLATCSTETKYVGVSLRSRIEIVEYVCPFIEQDIPY